MDRIASSVQLKSRLPTKIFFTLFSLSFEGGLFQAKSGVGPVWRDDQTYPEYSTWGSTRWPLLDGVQGANSRRQEPVNLDDGVTYAYSAGHRQIGKPGFVITKRSLTPGAFSFDFKPLGTRIL
jgi:hypothetical protein